MTDTQLMKNLSVPQGKIDVIIDTDAYNEIDDQFAISYMLKSTEKLCTKAIYAAPFSQNGRSSDPADGMQKSYDEILKLLKLADISVDVFKGSDKYLDDEKTPVISDAAKDLVEKAKNYSPEKPLYVVAIGAITNVASALLLKPEIAENIVIVWLGGHAKHFHNTHEYNMFQDVAAARVVFNSSAPLVQLPCGGVVSSFTISKPELEYWLYDKNPLADYLARNTVEAADSYAKGKPWTRVIWDVTAVAWLLNDNNRFMSSQIITAPLPTYDHLYAEKIGGKPMRYVYHINRDNLMQDLIEKLTR